MERVASVEFLELNSREPILGGLDPTLAAGAEPTRCRLELVRWTLEPVFCKLELVEQALEPVLCRPELVLYRLELRRSDWELVLPGLDKPGALSDPDS